MQTYQQTNIHHERQRGRRKQSNNFLQGKALEATKQMEEKRKNLSPRNRKACHFIGD
jgi:hypothetical protein